MLLAKRLCGIVGDSVIPGPLPNGRFWTVVLSFWFSFRSKNFAFSAQVALTASFNSPAGSLAKYLYESISDVGICKSISNGCFGD